MGFGMVDTSSTPAVGYMELVHDRTAATLIPITMISAHVAPGTEIWSDQWASYHNVGAIPGVTAHHTVNHSIQFVTGKMIKFLLIALFTHPFYCRNRSTYQHH